MSTGFTLPYVWLTTITALNNNVYGFCSSNINLTVGSVEYNGGVGSEPTTVSSKTGLSVDNLELTILKQDTTFTEEQVALGLLNSARVQINIEDALFLPSTIAQGNIVFMGYVARVQSFKLFYKIELRSDSSLLNTRANEKSSQYCRWEFGSPQCGVNLATANLQYSTTVVSSNPLNRTITVAVAPTTNQSRYFNGYIEITSGNNINAKVPISSYASGTTFTIRDRLPFSIASGTTVTIRAGCDFQVATCIGYNNIINFGGFPSAGQGMSDNWMRGMSEILKSGERSGETT